MDLPHSPHLRKTLAQGCLLAIILSAEPTLPLAALAESSSAEPSPSGGNAPPEPELRSLEPLREPTGVLSLGEALAATLLGNPELKAFASEVRAREALTLQAGLLPNPEFSTEVENVGGSGDRQGFEQTETTLLLSQLIELGGKRARREEVAQLGRDLASWDYASRRLAVLTQAAKAFASVRVAQERLAQVNDLVRLGEESLTTVERSVGAGATAPVETTRARVALGRVALERSSTERELEEARTRLASSWGASRAHFQSVSGELALIEPLPGEGALSPLLEKGPELARWKAELKEREAELSLEESQRIPDVTVGAGGRHFEENGDNAFVFEFAVPLPVFNRNQGAIEAARERVTKAAEERRAAELTVRVELAEAYRRLATAYEQARTLKAELLPEAERAYTGTLDAFRRGALRPLDVLEAQRTLFELRGEHLDALENFYHAAADIERLTGRPLRELAAGGDQ